MYSDCLPSGTIIHGKSFNYRIKMILGHGSFGIIYLASIVVSDSSGDIESKVNVAVKEFFMRGISERTGLTVTNNCSGISDNYKHKFIQEAQILSELEHPGIVRFEEAFEENGTAYYVMEYIEGQCLDEYIKKQGRLSERESTDIILRICRAISYMHDKMVLHLDIKPPNIMIRTDETIVVIDFGLSKQYNECIRLESSSVIEGGTSGYTPIEQSGYQGGKYSPTAMDVYALGATLYKMLTGICPPDALKILKDGVDVEFLKRQSISEHLIACIQMAMNPVIENRCQTVKELAALLNDDELCICPF